MRSHSRHARGQRGALVTSFPALEKTILKTLSEQEEMHPPEGALAREYFWIAASQLKARGLVDADQIAGVVRRVA